MYTQKRDIVTLYPKKIEDLLLNSGQAIETLALLEIRTMLKENGLDLRITLNTRNKFCGAASCRQQGTQDAALQYTTSNSAGSISFQEKNCIYAGVLLSCDVISMPLL